MLTERDTTSNEPFHDYNQPDPPEAKPRKKRAPRRKRVVEEPPAPRVESGQVKVKADFTMPVERFARLAEEEFDDDEEATEEVEEADPRDYRNMLHGNGLASMPVQPGVVAETHSESVREHLRQVSEANAFKARIWRVPDTFAKRNPLIQRKPANAIGWAYQGECAYDPETLDDDLLSVFSDGHYFVEVREQGKFVQGMLKTVGDPSSPEAAMPPTAQSAVIHEPMASAPDPMKEAKANIVAMNAVVDAATRLAEVAAHQQPPPTQKTPSLKERLEEFEMLKRIFSPPQTPQQADPFEKFLGMVQSEAFQKVLSTIKSDNPVAPVEPQSGFWDFAAGALESLAPGLNPLLAGAGRYLASLGQVPLSQSPAPATSAQPSQISAPVDAPPVVEAEEEETGVSIQFLVQDLIAQVPAELTAQKVKQMAANNPFVKPFLKQYLAKDNAALWEDLIALCESEEEATTLRNGLAECTWKDDWLNTLKQQLQS